MITDKTVANKSGDPRPDKKEISDSLNSRDPILISPDGHKEAAVLIPVFVHDKKWRVLLTRRSAKVEHHKGEISFPGGHRDDTDPDLEFTALRENEEEIGVGADEVEILGRIDDIITVTDFKVTPFVGIIPYPYDFVPSEIEIDEILVLPLDEFTKPENVTKQIWKKGEEDYPVYFFNIMGHNVWGATARMLKQFLEICMEFEEPDIS